MWAQSLRGSQQVAQFGVQEFEGSGSDMGYFGLKIYGIYSLGSRLQALWVAFLQTVEGLGCASVPRASKDLNPGYK